MTTSQHIAADNRRAVARVDALFNEAAARLADHPYLGKPGQVPGTRKLLPHKSYRLVYEIDGQTVWVLTLVHTARWWPSVRDLQDRSRTGSRTIDRT